MGAAVATNSAPSLVNFFSRGTSDRSVHRDALSAAACASRLRLCRGYSLIRQSSHSALHLFVEEVSPVIHHRLRRSASVSPLPKFWLRTGGTSSHGMPLIK